MLADEKKLKIVFLPARPWKIFIEQQPVEAAKHNDTFNKLRALGHEVEILTPVMARFRSFKSLNPFILGLDPIRALVVLFLRRDVDFIVSISESGALFILLLRGLLFFKPKIVLWDLSSGNSWRVVRLIQKIVLPRYDGFMVLTRVQLNYLKRHQYDAPISLIGYNVDDEFFKPEKAPLEDYILSVGDDISRDYQTLIAACKAIPLKLIIKSNQYIAETTNTTPNKFFQIKERLSSADYRSLIAKAKVVVLPLENIEHAGGITFLFETMAMGKPLVITQSSISDDFVINGVNGLVVPTRDVPAMQAAILRLLKDPDLAVNYGNRLRITLEQKYTTTHLALNIQKTLLRIIEQPRR